MLLQISIILAIVGLVLLVLYRWFSISKKKQSVLNTISQSPTIMNLPNEEQNVLELPPVVLRRETHGDNSQDLLQIPVVLLSQRVIENNSIIDITGQASVSIQEREPVLTTYSAKIPPWPHFYVYGHGDLNHASHDQKSFYNYFKREFLRGVYLDLEGYTNYAFILMFDLVKDSLSHGNVERLEIQLGALEIICPKTRSYGQNLLITRMRAVGDYGGVERLRQTQDQYQNENRYQYQSQYQYEYYDYWSLGNKYKKQLGLSDDEVTLLNKPSYSRSSFAGIESCCIAIMKLYLRVVPKMQAEFQKAETTFDEEVKRLSDLVARKHFRFRLNSSNYNYTIGATTTEFYTAIFKLCENAVREEFGHKRKLNVELSYTTALKEEIDSVLLSPIASIARSEVKQIDPPDESTEIEINAQNTTRWRTKFKLLTSRTDLSSKEFLQEVITLGSLNKKNPSVENIYFEASKFIAKQDKEAALILYLHYLYNDMRSSKFDNKQLTKTIQKNLFKNNEQLHEFERIVGQLINDKNLEAALSKVTQVYIPKRKQIVLDKQAIRDVKDKHTGTVELLNEYLKDEFENDQLVISAREISAEEVQIDINPKTETPISLVKTNVELNGDQQKLLQLFVKNNFNISIDETEDFAKSRGLFRNQLIESVNECCYEFLDDVLIEEETDNYLMNVSYYSALTNI